MPRCNARGDPCALTYALKHSPQCHTILLVGCLALDTHIYKYQTLDSCMGLQPSNQYGNFNPQNKNKNKNKNKTFKKDFRPKDFQPYFSIIKWCWRDLQPTKMVVVWTLNRITLIYSCLIKACNPLQRK